MILKRSIGNLYGSVTWGWKPAPARLLLMDLWLWRLRSELKLKIWNISIEVYHKGGRDLGMGWSFWSELGTRERPTAVPTVRLPPPTPMPNATEELMNLDWRWRRTSGLTVGMDVTATLDEKRQVEPEEGDIYIKVTLKGWRRHWLENQSGTCKC